ncbi:MAG: hypothetical protein LLG44_08415 [Chloroflexi bacterium]|nr:hypothetical protein [Chloroflexota bacterium]
MATVHIPTWLYRQCDADFTRDVPAGGCGERHKEEGLLWRTAISYGFVYHLVDILAALAGISSPLEAHHHDPLPQPSRVNGCYYRLAAAAGTHPGRDCPR